MACGGFYCNKTALQDLRVLDPDGFRRLLEVREGPSSLPCSITQYLNHYLFNSVATSLLLLTLVFTFSLVSSSTQLSAISCTDSFQIYFAA